MPFVGTSIIVVVVVVVVVAAVAAAPVCLVCRYVEGVVVVV